jgi:transcription elongation factor GreA
MSQITYYTEGGLKKLKDELHQLKSVERPSITQQIAEARDKGDLSENAEYDAAKEAQGLLEARISKMEVIVGNARIIDESQVDTSKVYILSKVRILHEGLKKELNYTLVAENEADLKLGKISVDSPIGKALLGKELNDSVEITIPNGIMKVKILEISR